MTRAVPTATHSPPQTAADAAAPEASSIASPSMPLSVGAATGSGSRIRRRSSHVPVRSHFSGGSRPEESVAYSLAASEAAASLRSSEVRQQTLSWTYREMTLSLENRRTSADSSASPSMRCRSPLPPVGEHASAQTSSDQKAHSQTVTQTENASDLPLVVISQDSFSPIFGASPDTINVSNNVSQTTNPIPVSLLSEGVQRNPATHEPSSWSSAVFGSFPGAMSMQKAEFDRASARADKQPNASGMRHASQRARDSHKQRTVLESSWHDNTEPQNTNLSGMRILQSPSMEQSTVDEAFFVDHGINEHSSLLGNRHDDAFVPLEDSADYGTSRGRGGSARNRHDRSRSGSDDPNDPFRTLPRVVRPADRHTLIHQQPSLDRLSSYAFIALKSLPAVSLALILNLLDAMSYGIIIFPASDKRLPESAAQSGISMFLVSTIISQIVYTFGGSQFRGAVGSQMIEVMPFLHVICTIIESKMTSESDQAVTATIMIAYATSTILTGLFFLAMGFFKLGSLIQFFPRHILVGCIGGIGLFLLFTAIEVTSGFKAELSFSYLGSIFDPSALKLWGSSLGCALLLKLIQSRFSHPLLVPSYYVILPVMFYSITLSLGVSVETLRSQGWLFDLPSATDVPFWTFWTYIDMRIVDWNAIAATIPTQLALAFFGILHVPINVPALAVSTKQDVDLSTEIMGHGVSNILAGLIATPQNYLVYSNSLLYIRSGGDSRISGAILTLANVLLWIKGGGVIGYVPVLVVGSLIFHLGIDLFIESVVDTWYVGIHPLEYMTILVIVAVMGVIGFTEGVVAGIVLACIFFVVMYSRRSIIRESFNGSQLRSTVHRLYRHQIFLDKCGDLIHIIKLQGFMFFGTINQLESHIKKMFEDTPKTRFVVMDFSLISGIDYSALESFQRIRRLVSQHNTYLVLCGLGALHGDLVKSGIFDALDDDEDASERMDSSVEAGGDDGGLRVHHFNTLNEALEYCENSLLETFYNKYQTREALSQGAQNAVPVESGSSHNFQNVSGNAVEIGPHAATPRQMQVDQAASLVLGAHPPTGRFRADLAQPVSVLLQAFSEVADLESVLGDICGEGFELVRVPRGHELYNVGDAATDLYVVEEGELVMVIPESPTGGERVVETLLPGTMVGELEMFAGRPRSCRLFASSDAVLWRMSRASFERLSRAHPDLMLKFVTKVALSFDAERFYNTLRHWAQFR